MRRCIYKWGRGVLFIAWGGVGATPSPHHQFACSPSSSIGSNRHIIKGGGWLSMCFFAWRHANGGGATKGRQAMGGGAGQPPYDRWILPPSSRSLAHMSWVGVDGCRCLSRWLCCLDTSTIYVMLHLSLWCWTDLRSVVEKPWRTSPMDQWHGKGRWGTERCPCGVRWCHLVAYGGPPCSK